MSYQLLNCLVELLLLPNRPMQASCIRLCACSETSRYPENGVIDLSCCKSAISRKDIPIEYENISKNLQRTSGGIGMFLCRKSRGAWA